jgi:putative ABC transport system permease protein
MIMLKNYILIAFRNLRRHRSFSLINILGLSLGLACCLLLTLYIQDEISYDQHLKRKDDVYRIVTEFKGVIGIDKLGTASPPIAMALAEEIPEVEAAARLLTPPGASENLIKYNDNVFYVSEGYLGDSSIFDVLTFDIVEGNPSNALEHPNSIAIAESLSKKLFGNESALNKSFLLSQGNEPFEVKVTAVYKDQKKSFIAPNFIVNISSGGWGQYLKSKNAANEWAGQNFVPSYLKLTPGHDRATVIKKINEILVKYGAESMKALGISKTLTIEPVKDIHLRSDVGQTPRINAIYIVASIALFILVLACINFMNLSTAKATKRAAEIGVRKVLGAFRSSLIYQLLGEAIILVMIAVIISLVMIQLGLPYFNTLTGKEITMDLQHNLPFLAMVVLIVVITGVLAGSYPAFYLSSFQPAKVLKGQTSLGNASGRLRQSLVVLQFVIGIALVCSMLIISKQMTFMENKNLGFNSDAKVIFPLRTESAQKSYAVLQKEWSKIPGVNMVSGTDYIPGSRVFNDMPLYKAGENMDVAKLHRLNEVDYNYMDILGLKLIAGRKFTDNRKVDGGGKMILNIASVKELQLTPEEAVGQKLYFDWQGETNEYEVIGVMDDYHQASLKEKIYPMAFRLVEEDNSLSFAVVDIKADQFGETKSAIEKTWKSLVNDTPFEFYFLDENIQKQYTEDRKGASIITTFTVIAMLISCLGLYGLSTYMTERRFREIGIRKVMGASVKEILSLMTGEFIKLVVIAFLIAVPLAWYGMSKWLETFAYRIDIGVAAFLIAGGAAVIIALLTVSVESFRAATSDPVKALKSE